MKKNLLAIALLFSTPTMNATSAEMAAGITAAFVATAATATSIIITNLQARQLKLDTAKYPAQKDIYQANNLSLNTTAVNYLALFSELGVIACFLSPEKAAPAAISTASIIATGLLAAFTYEQRLNIENEAAIARLKGSANN